MLLQMPISPPRVLDEYCDPVDLKRATAVNDDPNVLGACSSNNSQPDDDYSVPYEVKKIMSGMVLADKSFELSFVLIFEL